MFDNLKAFWLAFKAAWNAVFKRKPDYKGIQTLQDDEHYNLKHSVILKVNNLVNNEATFEVTPTTAAANPLVDLGEDLESERYKITERMLDMGDCFIFPAHTQQGELYHSILSQEQVVINTVDGGKIIEAYGILATEKIKDTVFRLVRKHKLDNQGNLTVSYMTVNEQGKEAYIEAFSHISGKEITYPSVNHIGFGRYRSPVSGRGLSPDYGVPINFKCSKIEQDIFETFKQIETEFLNAESKIFANDILLAVNDKKDGNKKEYKVMPGVIPVRKGAGETGSQIDIFSPDIRSSAYYDKLTKQLEEYEREIGVSKGMLTENTLTVQATATEVRRTNADTIALLNRIRSAIEQGNKDTLTADCVYLNISPTLFDVSADWFDPFEDPAEQWNRLQSAKELGAVKTERLTRWLFPYMTDDEIVEELARANEELSNKDDVALEMALRG